MNYRNKKRKHVGNYVNYNEISSDDFTYGEGREEDLVGRLQRELGKSRDEIRRMMDNI